VFAVLILAGLATSLTIKRRRFWARIRPERPTDGDTADAAGEAGAGTEGRQPEDVDRRRRNVSSHHSPAGSEERSPRGHFDAGAGGAVIELGGLARTDQAGYGEEFARMRADLLPERDNPGRDPEHHGGTA
ncbi:MAG: hypothetical protein J2P19_31250, partial [Pseudonocardia sp.]|nr:hypothetical protein [Pseudonocardia sp.]